MEVKYLNTIKKIIDTGSYQNAAKALNYAQSTITFQVRQIEQELGLSLFEKKGKRMVLTQEGKEILPLIDNVLETLDELVYSSKNKQQASGSLKVALPETLLTYQMQPLLSEFKKQAPNVKLSLKVMNCFEIYEQLRMGTIDIAIHYDVKKYDKNIIVKEINSFPLTFVASSQLQKSEHDFISDNQVKSICHIQNDPDALYLKMFNHYLRKKNIALEPSLELWSIEAIKRSVISNLGVAFLPKFTVEHELENKLLIELPLDISNPQITAIYAYKKRKYQTFQMSLFLSILDNLYQ